MNTTEIQLRTQRDNLKIQLNDLKSTYEKQKELYSIGAISKSDIQLIESNIKQIEKRYRESVTEYENLVGLAQDNIEDRFIKSPIDGMVASVNISVNETVSNIIAMEIISDRKNIKTYITSRHLNQIENGMEVIIYPNGDPNQKTSGKIEWINYIPEEKTGLYEVNISMEESELQIWPGEYAELEIIISKRVGLVVSKKALINIDGQYYLFINQDDFAKKIPVTIGITNNEIVEILSGLEKNQKVVLLGKEYLRDGDPIKTE